MDPWGRSAASPAFCFVDVSRSILAPKSSIFVRPRACNLAAVPTTPYPYRKLEDVRRCARRWSWIGSAVSVRDDMTEEIAALQRIKSVLRARLEPVEEYQAMCQLEAREHNQDPLIAIDGVQLRGRLARRLDEKNGHWRALLGVEAALAALEAEAGIRDQPLLRLATLADKLSPRLAAAQAVDALSSPSGPQVPLLGEPKVANPLEPQSPAEDRPSQPAPSYTRPPAPTVTDARAKSSVPANQSAPPAAVTLETTVAPDAQAPAAPAEGGHRTILDRIKPIKTVATRSTAATGTPPAREAPWSRGVAEPLPPAIDEPTKISVARPLAPVTAPASPSPAAEPRRASADAPKAPAASSAPPDRVGTLETELARLIKSDKLVPPTGPVANAITRSRPILPTPRKPIKRREIDTDLDTQDTPEAEVSIVRKPDPLPALPSEIMPEQRTEVKRDRPWLPDPALVRRSPQEREKREPANRGLSRLTRWGRDRKAANDDHSSLGYEPLDVEEAEVEIIVPSQVGSPKEPRLS